MQTVARVIFMPLGVGVVYWGMKRPNKSFFGTMAVVVCAAFCWEPADGQGWRLMWTFIGASTSAGKAGIFHGLGKTFPGAATPYGMVQVSPNTITGGDNGSGYSYEHTSIEGFAFTQMSGVGWYGDLGSLVTAFSREPFENHPRQNGPSR